MLRRRVRNNAASMREHQPVQKLVMQVWRDPDHRLGVARCLQEDLPEARVRAAGCLTERTVSLRACPFCRLAKLDGCRHPAKFQLRRRDVLRCLVLVRLRIDHWVCLHEIASCRWQLTNEVLGGGLVGLLTLDLPLHLLQRLVLVLRAHGHGRLEAVLHDQTNRCDHRHGWLRRVPQGQGSEKAHELVHGRHAFRQHLVDRREVLHPTGNGALLLLHNEACHVKGCASVSKSLAPCTNAHARVHVL